MMHVCMYVCIYVCVSKFYHQLIRYLILIIDADDQVLKACNKKVTSPGNLAQKFDD